MENYTAVADPVEQAPIVVLAEWKDNILGPPPTPLPDAFHPDSKFRPIKVRHYIKVSVCYGEQIESLSLASVLWFKPHAGKDAFGKPAQIWQYNNFEVGGLYSFIPVQCLKCRCSFSKIVYDNEFVLVIVPLIE